MKKINLFIITVLITTISWGQVFLDNFDYPTNTTTLNSQAWGFVLSSTAATTPAAVSDGAGLTYTGYSQSGIGRSVILKSIAGQSVGRYHANIPAPSTATIDTTFYMSYLLNVSTVPTAASSANINFAGIMVGSASNPGFTCRSYIRSITGSSTTYNLGIAKATTPTYATTALNINTTYLIVVKYSAISGSNTNDIVSMWINPAISASEPAATIANINGANDPSAALTGPGFMQRATGPVCEVDAVRTGPKWSDVIMPPPVVPGVLTTSLTSLNFGGLPSGTTSMAQSFNLSGTNLTGFPGVINVTAPTNYEVSNDNTTWGTSTSIAYSAASLVATPIYVRFTPSTIGALSGTLTLSGGGVLVPPSVALSGGGATVFYSKPTGTLEVETNWGTSPDGTGTVPPNFVNDYQIFIICNRASYVLEEDFQVFGMSSGTGSKIVVGNGIDSINLILPQDFTLFSDLDHRVDVSNRARVEVANKIYRPDTKIPFPYFGNVANNSTVEYNWNGAADTIRVPAETFGNLKLKKGLKYFASGFAFVNGTLVIDSVDAINGTGNGSASVLVRGNITKNSSFFDTDPTTGDANRISLNFGGTGTQTITGGDFYVGQLRTQAVSSTVPAFALDVVLGLNTNIITGTTTAGGFNFQQPTHNLSLNGNTLTMLNGSSFVPFASATAPGNLGTITGTSTSNVIINKTVGSAAVGTVAFASGGQVLNNFNFNAAGAGNNNLTLNSPLTVNGTLSLNAGKILLGNNTLTAAGTISGGASTGYIVTNGTGALKINGVGATTKTFPVGPSATLYHPATIKNNGTVDDFAVKVSSTIAPCRLAANTVNATWDIAETTPGFSDCELSLDYTGATGNGASYDAATAKIFHCNGTGADYSSGTVTGTIGSGSGFSSFSPFTISSDLAVLAISNLNFSGFKNANGVTLQWFANNENNVFNYQLQSSNDGVNFVTINTVAARNGNANSAYNFNDVNPITSKRYYRIIQISNSNQRTISQVIKITSEAISKFDIANIILNSSKTNATVMVNAPNSQVALLKVYNATGSLIYSKNLTIAMGVNALPINIEHYALGVYIVSLQTKEGNISTRFIK